jgi:hypothetical protein
MPNIANHQAAPPSVLTGGQPASGENSETPASTASIRIPQRRPRQGRMCRPHLASSGYTSVKYVV